MRAFKNYSLNVWQLAQLQADAAEACSLLQASMSASEDTDRPQGL